MQVIWPIGPLFKSHHYHYLFIFNLIHYYLLCPAALQMVLTLHTHLPSSRTHTASRRLRGSMRLRYFGVMQLLLATFGYFMHALVKWNEMEKRIGHKLENILSTPAIKDTSWYVCEKNLGRDELARVGWGKPQESFPPTYPHCLG